MSFGDKLSTRSIYLSRYRIEYICIIILAKYEEYDLEVKERDVIPEVSMFTYLGSIH